jgi:hypothetical protein
MDSTISVFSTALFLLPDADEAAVAQKLGVAKADLHQREWLLEIVDDDSKDSKWREAAQVGAVRIHAACATSSPLACMLTMRVPRGAGVDRVCGVDRAARGVRQRRRRGPHA